MQIILPPELSEALRKYAADNSRSQSILTPQAAAIEILAYFLHVKKEVKP